jgi:hypothetical protein
MVENGIVDYRLAKRKAAERLAVSTLGALPSNAQIESCLAERQRLFQPELHAERLSRLRQLSLKLMLMLRLFEPRLVGSVLAGTATVTSAIELHLFSSGAEIVAAELENQGFNPTACERRFRFGGGRQALVPGFRFRVSGEPVVVLVFGEHGIREAPLSQVDRRPMRRASIRRLEALMEG